LFTAVTIALEIAIPNTYIFQCYSWGSASEYQFKINDFASTGAG